MSERDELYVEENSRCFREEIVMKEEEFGLDLVSERIWIGCGQNMLNCNFLLVENYFSTNVGCV